MTGRIVDRFRQAVLPGTTNVWVQVCNDCGAVVLDESQHDEWHLELEDDPDDEQFCPNCLAGMESSEHHEKCESR